MHIFYTPTLEGADWVLSEEESKHCARVLRLVPGDELVLVDGRGGWYRAAISEAHPKHTRVNILAKEENYQQRPYYLHLIFAPTKSNDRNEWLLEKATEIGVDEITPVITQNSERHRVKPERWQRILVAAMKQSLKAYLPQLNPLIKLHEWLQQETHGQLFIAHCRSGTRNPLFQACSPGHRINLLIGPEGDFTQEEVEHTLAQGWQAVSLGSSRLRTETAAVVACHTVFLRNS